MVFFGSFPYDYFLKKCLQLIWGLCKLHVPCSTWKFYGRILWPFSRQKQLREKFRGLISEQDRTKTHELKRSIGWYMYMYKKKTPWNTLWNYLSSYMISLPCFTIALMAYWRLLPEVCGPVVLQSTRSPAVLSPRLVFLLFRIG